MAGQGWNHEGYRCAKYLKWETFQIIYLEFANDLDF